MAEYAPSLMTEHVLNHPKGWFGPQAVDHVAKLSANVTFTVREGRVMHLNAAGEFEMGVNETSMAIFALQASNAHTVINPGRTATGGFMHQAVLPAGNMSGLVAIGGFALESSEFDDTLEYAPGDLLTAGDSNTVAATGGVLTNAGSGGGGDVQQFVDPVCGVVNEGVKSTEHSTRVVCFWPVWLPGAYVA